MPKIELIHGDCLIAMKDIPDGSIDMILCDLPYGTTACKWDAIIPFEPLWEQYKRIIKDNGAIVLTASQPFTTNLIASNMDWFKYGLIWVKPQGVDPFMSKIRPLNNIEDVLVFCNGKTIYNPQKTKGKPYSITRDKKPRLKETSGVIMRETTTVNGGDRLPTRILEFKQEKGLHPTQKPVALFEYLIKTYTNENDMVLDNTMGSGTAGVACKNLNRNFIGIEKDPEYFKIAEKRINENL
jgi:site-specific DNA-methyltransferase (adenine-specific)